MAEIHRAALGIGEAAVIEHLQQEIEHLRVGLLHLIEQQHGVGPAPHRLGELSPLLVAHVARRRAHQAGHRVALHVLTHVEAHQRLFLIEQGGRQGLRQLGLADAAGAQEQERSHRPGGGLHAGAGPADRRGHRRHRLRLADHPLAEAPLQIEQLLALARQQPLHRDAGPAGHHIGDVALLHLLAQHRVVGELRLQGLAAELQVVQLVELQPGRLLQVAIALGLGDGMTQVFIALQKLAQLRQPIPLFAPTPLQLLQLFVGLPPPLLQLQPLLQRGRLGGEQGQLHPPQLGLRRLHHLGLGGDLHAQLGGGLIDQVDGGIGEAAVADVAVGQAGGRHQSPVGDRDAVVELVALPQATQDLNAGVAVGLAHRDLLEAALEGGVLFNAAPVILCGGGADAAQLAPRQGRLEDAGGVGAGALTAHQRVQLIEEEHHPLAGDVAIAHLLEHTAQALLELAAELGAGDESAEVEGHQPQAAQGLRHLAGNDALGERLGHGGFADAGLTDQHRVVFAAAGEHLNQPADFGVAADHRIELASAGGGGEVAAESLQGRAGLHRLQAQIRAGGGRGGLADGVHGSGGRGGSGGGRSPRSVDPGVAGGGTANGRSAGGLRCRRHRRCSARDRHGRGGGHGGRHGGAAAAGAPLAQQQVLAESLLGQQGAADAGLVDQGQEQVGDVQQAGAPGRAAAIGRLQQILEGIADVKAAAAGAGLAGAEGFETVEQAAWLQGQRIDPRGEAGLLQQGEQQMLHVHRAVAPATGLVLARQQQFPGVVAEAIRVAREAGGGGSESLGDHGGESAGRNFSRSGGGGSTRKLDQLDAVAIGILHEGDHGGAALHRPGVAHDAAALGADRRAGGLDVLTTDGDVPIGVTQGVSVGVPIPGELEHRSFALVAVAHESEGVAARLVIAAAQQAHAQNLGVEGDRTLQVADPKHGVEQTHGGLPVSPFWPAMPAAVRKGTQARGGMAHRIPPIAAPPPCTTPSTW